MAEIKISRDKSVIISRVGGVGVEIEDAVAVITIDRPDVRNAIGSPTVDELHAADDIKIGFNQVSLGIMPAWGGAERLTQVVGRGRALLAIATGEIYEAPEAQRLGLIDIVVPRETFEKEWRTLAERIAGTAPGTSRSVKSVIAAAAPSTHPELEADATDTFARLWTSDAHWAAVEALEQRRRPG